MADRESGSNYSWLWMFSNSYQGDKVKVFVCVSFEEYRRFHRSERDDDFVGQGSGVLVA